MKLKIPLLLLVLSGCDQKDRGPAPTPVQTASEKIMEERFFELMAGIERLNVAAARGALFESLALDLLKGPVDIERLLWASAEAAKEPIGSEHDTKAIRAGTAEFEKSVRDALARR